MYRVETIQILKANGKTANQGDTVKKEELRNVDDLLKNKSISLLKKQPASSQK